MSASFGTYTQNTPIVEPGIYDAIIESVNIVMDQKTNAPKLTDSNKNQVDVLFRIDREIALNRRFTISFGKNSQNGQYAAFATFLSTLTGIPLSDVRALQALMPDDLIGKRCRIVTITTPEGYVNIDSIAPPPKSKPAQAKPITESSEEEYNFPDEVPF